jgi:hypothetical protein
MSLIKDHLFSDGGGWSGRQGLREIMEQHQRVILDRIQRIQSLNQMTDDVIRNIVRDSLVEPPSLDIENMTYNTRTEEIAKAIFPMEFRFFDGSGTFPKQVARISIPFRGDPACFRYAASTFGTASPNGRISGRVIEFDVIFWGYQDDEERLKRQVEEQKEGLKTYMDYAAEDVRKFNQQLPGIVEAAFRKRLEEFTKHTSFLDSLGIKAESPSSAKPPIGKPESPPAKKREPRPVQIIQHIQAMYVQELNQTNNNSGDVNNAIQSD